MCGRVEDQQYLPDEKASRSGWLILPRPFPAVRTELALLLRSLFYMYNRAGVGSQFHSRMYLCNDENCHDKSGA
jgi:hypothetical protein